MNGTAFGFGETGVVLLGRRKVLVHTACMRGYRGYYSTAVAGAKNKVEFAFILLPDLKCSNCRKEVPFSERKDVAVRFEDWGQLLTEKGLQ